MRKTISETIEIPEGVECEYNNNALICKKNNHLLERKMHLAGIMISVNGKKITLSSESANKIQYKIIKSYAVHIKNMFSGLENQFVYNLEACNVHFPMTLKVEGGFLLINNFLGEKMPRRAKILPEVQVEIKGQKITLSSSDKEAAGQTAANIEKATKIRNRDRRIFQDGIFLTGKPGGSR